MVVITPPAEAAKPNRAAKVTICHRTASITNPYRRITVSVQGAKNHRTQHTGDTWSTTTASKTPKWGDIIPDFDTTGTRVNGLTARNYDNGGGATESEKRGYAIFNGTTYSGVNYSGKCGVMTTKQFIQIQVDAGETLTDVFTDLDTDPAAEDLALQQALGGSFNTWYQAQKTANGGVDLALTDISSSLDTNSPAATTLAVSNLADTSGNNNATVTLNGTFSPKNMSTSTSIYFEYSTISANIGTASSDGLSTAYSGSSGIKITNPSNVESNTITIAANQTGTFTIKGFLTGLTESTTYYYRVVGLTTSGSGDAAVDTLIPGGIRSFTTTSAAKSNQTIDFGSIADQSGTSYTAQATSKKTDNTNTDLTVSFTSLDTAICTVGSSSISSGVSSVTVTKVAPGLCQLTTSQAGDATYNAATAVDQNFYFLATQSITFEQPAGKTYGDAAFSIPATSFDTTPAKSLLTVTFTSTDTDVCTVGSSAIADGVSTATVTIVKAGDCIITATQAGGTNSNSVKFSAANSVSRTIVISKADLTITADNKTKNDGDSEPVWSISKSGLKGSDTVTSATYNFSSAGYASSTTAPTATGSYTITPSAAVFSVGNANNYNITYATGTYQITSNASQSITFAQPANQVYNASTYTLVATASSTLTVSFTSSTTSICTVSGTTLTKVAAGNCTIVASQAGGTVSSTTYGAATDVPRTFEITKATLTITSGFTAANKVFDGAVTADVTCGSIVLTGKIGAEDVSVSCTGMSGTFNNKNVADGKQVTGSGLTLTGTKSGNYQLTQPTTTANVTKAPLTLTAADASKAAGASDPTFTSNLTGAISGEAVTVSSVSYSRAAGESLGTYAITPSGGTLSNSNYEITTYVTGTLTISAVATPTISTTSLPDGTVSTAYSTTLTATGGSGTYSTWALTSGTLPAGISLTAGTGVIAGTPTIAGTTSLVFTVTDSNSQTSPTKTLTILINAASTNNDRGNQATNTPAKQNSGKLTVNLLDGKVVVPSKPNTPATPKTPNTPKPTQIIDPVSRVTVPLIGENGNKPEIKEVKTIQSPVQSSLDKDGNLEFKVPIGYEGTTKIELKQGDDTEPTIVEIPVVGPKPPGAPNSEAIEKPRFIAPVEGKVNVVGLDNKVSVSWKPEKEAAAYEVKSGEDTVCLTVYATCLLPSANNQSREFTVQSISNTGVKANIATGQGAAIPSGTLLAVVYFETDKSRLTKKSVATLTKLVNDLQALGLRDVYLAGHTDTRQSVTYNQRLSANRSTSVQKWLGQTVVDAVITKEQYGESKLAEDETGVVGKQINRRVEIRVS